MASYYTKGMWSKCDQVRGSVRIVLVKIGCYIRWFAARALRCMKSKKDLRTEMLRKDIYRY